jgi:hypothetical protein
VGVLGLVAFALTGYFALYTWLRANDEIIIMFAIGYPSHNCSYVASWRDARGPYFDVDEDWPWESDTLPRREWLPFAILWPAVKVEVALDRRGWLPKSCMDTVPPGRDRRLPQLRYYDDIGSRGRPGHSAGSRDFDNEVTDCFDAAMRLITVIGKVAVIGQIVFWPLYFAIRTGFWGRWRRADKRSPISDKSS